MSIIFDGGTLGAGIEIVSLPIGGTLDGSGLVTSFIPHPSEAISTQTITRDILLSYVDGERTS
jgi:hypothetical protein